MVISLSSRWRVGPAAMRGEQCPENIPPAPHRPDGQTVLPKELALFFSPQSRLTVPCSDVRFFPWS